MIEDLRLAEDEENQARIFVGSTLPRRIRSKNEGGCLIMEYCFQAKLLLINCSDAFDVLRHRLVLGTLKLLLMATSYLVTYLLYITVGLRYLLWIWILRQRSQATVGCNSSSDVQVTSVSRFVVGNPTAVQNMLQYVRMQAVHTVITTVSQYRYIHIRTFSQWNPPCMTTVVRSLLLVVTMIHGVFIPTPKCTANYIRHMVFVPLNTIVT